MQISYSHFIVQLKSTQSFFRVGAHGAWDATCWRHLHTSQAIFAILHVFEFSIFLFLRIIKGYNYFNHTNTFNSFI